MLFRSAGMNLLYSKYLNDIENSVLESDIFTVFLNEMDDSYLGNTSNPRKVIDYIAGMTDGYLKRMIEKHTNLSIHSDISE